MLYGVTQDNSKLKSSRDTLETIYAQIPETKGCMEHINLPKNAGGCGAFCCRELNPQVLYVEFLNAWNNIVQNWKDEQIFDLIGRALRTYLFPSSNRGCIFFDKEKNLCGHHNVRNYNCRTYGIIPEEEFKPRYERLKILYPSTKPQCNLVSTVNGSVVTKKDTDHWWELLKSAEVTLGVKPELIHDGDGGSYRTYHDHLLLHLLGENGLADLTQIRISDDLILKENTHKSIMDGIITLKDKIIEKKEGIVADPKMLNGKRKWKKRKKQK